MTDLTTWTVYEYNAAGHLVPVAPAQPLVLALALHEYLERAEAATERPRSYTTRPDEMSGCEI